MNKEILSCVENLNFKGRVFKLSYKKVLYTGVAKRFNLDLDYVDSKLFQIYITYMIHYRII